MMPTIGRIVHYVLAEQENQGQVRPAIITFVFSETIVNLTVFPDGSHDRDRPLVPYCVTSVKLGEEEGVLQIGTWHWPERAGVNEVEGVSNA